MRIAVTAFLLLGVVAACADDQGDPTDARRAIETANAQFAERVKDHNATALASFYTPDCIVLPPDHVMVRGREMVAAFWSEAFQNGLKTMVLTTVDVERHMDVAVETGRFRLTVDVHGKPVDSAGKYVVVWKKQPSGVWQLHRDIWNAAPPAK